MSIVVVTGAASSGVFDFKTPTTTITENEKIKQRKTLFEYLEKTKSNFPPERVNNKDFRDGERYLTGHLNVWRRRSSHRSMHAQQK